VKNLLEGTSMMNIKGMKIKVWIQRNYFMAVRFASVLFLAPNIGLANFYDNHNPDQAERSRGRISRFGEENAPRFHRGPASVPTPIEGSSFAGSSQRPRSAESQGRQIASVASTSEVVKQEGLTVSEIKKRNGIQEIAIISNDQGFFPSNIVLTKGVPARLFLSTSSKEDAQCFVLEDFNVHRQIKQNKIEEVQFTPETEGQYTFYCPINGAKGNLLVKAIR
jgi:plastocyanin